MLVVPSPIQIGNILSFVFAVVIGEVAPLEGRSNKDISDNRPTAFTPAGYAFSIWALIYALAAFSVLWLALPSQRGYADGTVSYFLILNFISNGCWSLAFDTQVLDLWLSVCIIFLGILFPLIALYMRMKIGQDYLLPSRLAVGDALVHGFVSLYVGWVSVACIANVSLALSPHPMGDQSAWSVAMQCAAFCIATLFLFLHLDWVAAFPIAWGLTAIAVNQQKPEYPGSAATVIAGYLLGGILWGWILSVVVYRLLKATGSSTADASRPLNRADEVPSPLTRQLA